MPTTLPPETDVAIIGSGFSGLAMAYRLKRAGREDFVILERANDVGGTWRDNSYPGAACDVPSHVYSFSFAPNSDWSRTFSPQREIHDYLRRVADEHGLTEHVRFGCELEDAQWLEDEQRWSIQTSSGVIAARSLVAAAGPLSEPSIPDVPGLRDFKGTVFHSATWDHDHDLRGERVAVIGTGASAIQFVPQIQPEVARLHLFQRTPPWIMPRPDRPITDRERAIYRRFPIAQRAMRAAVYWAREGFAIPMLRVRLSWVTERLARAHMRKQVRDRELLEKVTPDYRPGCKRILISNDYLPALGKPNVDVVTGAVTEVREHSVLGSDGIEREVDTIIFGTGFHVTDLPIAERVRGRDGTTLAKRWNGSLSAHRGTTVAGYPNFFILLGPNTGLGHNSVVYMAEAQADYVMRALTYAGERALAAIEPRPEAEQAWNESVQRRMQGTVWTAGGCASWYFDAKGRNTTLWPDFSFRFRRALSSFDPAEHVLEPARAPEREEVAA